MQILLFEQARYCTCASKCSWFPSRADLSQGDSDGRVQRGTTDNANHRHPPSHSRYRRRAAQPRLLHAHARHAPPQKDGEPGRHQRLSFVLRRRRGDTRHRHHLLRLGGEAREARYAHSISRTGLRVAGEQSLQWWKKRFEEEGVTHGDIVERDARKTLDFEDFEGQRLSLIDDGGAGEAHAWERSPVPAEHQIRGLGPITISVPDLKSTDLVLTRALGMGEVREYAPAANEGPRPHVYEMGKGGPAAELHVA